jgi:hypothetical protein
MYSPTVVRFVMAAPVILSDGATLDALAAYQGFANGGDGVQLLDTLFAKEGRVHCCSWLYAEQEHVVDRAEFVRLQRVGPALNGRNLAASRATERFRVDNKRGDAVNILTTFTTISTASVWAFATADPSLVSELLTSVASIGLKRGNGFGKVQRIEVSVAEGWPGFGRAMPDGTPARAIPEDEWDGDAKRGAYAIGFPRWSSNPERCVIPTNRIIDPSIFGTLTPVNEPTQT